MVINSLISMGTLQNVVGGRNLHKVGIGLIACVLAFFSFSTVLSQPTRSVPDSIKTELNDEQLRKYKNQRLSVMFVFPDQPNIDVTNKKEGDLIDPEESRKQVLTDGNAPWIAYEGDFKIDEADFYRIAGKDKLAKEAEANQIMYKKKAPAGKVILQVIAAGLVGYGLYKFIAKGKGDIKSQNDSYINIYTASGVGLGSAASFIPDKRIKIPPKERTSQDKATKMLQANKVARSYNQQLVQELTATSEREVNIQDISWDQPTTNGFYQLNFAK